MLDSGFYYFLLSHFTEPDPADYPPMFFRYEPRDIKSFTQLESIALDKLYPLPMHLAFDTVYFATNYKNSAGKRLYLIKHSVAHLYLDLGSWHPVLCRIRVWG